MSPVGDGDSDGPEDEGDDGQQQHRPREGRLVLRVATAIAEANINLDSMQLKYQNEIFSFERLLSQLFGSR